MKARGLTEGRPTDPYGQDDGGRIDQAWKENAGNFAATAEFEAARIKLAEAMLSVVREGVSEVEALKANPVQVMAQDYRLGKGEEAKKNRDAF